MEYRVKRSADYSRTDNSDFLEHRSHKYIKKAFVNGKWRYYYSVPKGHSGYGTQTNNRRLDLSIDYGDEYDKNVMRNRRSTKFGDAYDQETYMTYGRKELGAFARATARDTAEHLRQKTAQAVATGKQVVSNILKKIRK